MASKRTRAKAGAVPHTPARIKLPQGTEKIVSPDQLLLDPENLRLLEADVFERLGKIKAERIGEPSVQDLIWTTLVKDPRSDIEALADSILTNGFLKHERIVTAPYDGARFLVLEGNRRVSAIRLINQMSPEEVPSVVLESIQAIPVMVLNEHGFIVDNPKALDAYRKDSLAFIGIRHLMGFQKWEPASRYEFQARLLESGEWSPEELAKHFGRSKTEVLRDYRAHKLYQKFRTFEANRRIEHTPTYNAFSEAARGSGIQRWLGWSDTDLEFKNETPTEAFFQYLVTRVRPETDQVGDYEGRSESAESAVRNLNKMLLLEDPEIEEALVDRDYSSAVLLYEQRKQGRFRDKLRNFMRAFKTASVEELTEHKEEVVKSLNVLIELATKYRDLIERTGDTEGQGSER